MKYPNYASALANLFADAPNNGIKNASALANVIGVSTSTISRHLTGEIMPGPDLFEKIAGAFLPVHQEILIRAYMKDCLPPRLRESVRPEVAAELMREETTDDIAQIHAALKVFSPEHLSAIRYLLERAASNPGIKKALISTANAMRGQ